MNRVLKLAIVITCFSLCGAGTFIVPAPQDEQLHPKTHVVPVRNRETVHHVWTWA
ncbi:MAG TPA: hypothetical protein VFX07_03950 [Candidatus Udaeobacter sp.]|nr:hypothetical protein [Candidatus Udaeobacter sp.]